GEMQIVDTALPDEISPTNCPRGVNQHLMLARAKQQTAHDAAFERIERDAIKTHQAIGAGVVANAATWPKLRAGSAITVLRFDRLDGFHRLGSGTDRQLCAQAIVQACFTIDAMVGGVGVRDVLIPAYLRNPGGGLVKGALRRGQ